MDQVNIENNTVFSVVKQSQDTSFLLALFSMTFLISFVIMMFEQTLGKYSYDKNISEQVITELGVLYESYKS